MANSPVSGKVGWTAQAVPVTIKTGSCIPCGWYVVLFLLSYNSGIDIDSIGFFSTFNKIYPLFRRDTFQALFDRQYSTETPQEGSSFAALNIVLAIGCCLASESLRADIQRVEPSCTDSLAEMSWKFFQNAYSMFFNMLFLQFDLLAVQTLIAMVIRSISVIIDMILTLKRHSSCKQQ